jgi:transcriptional regulator with XRE-family HTH domain
MRQKQLKLRDVERRARGEITHGYVSSIINGRVKNVSLDKLKALAKGLEVDVHELFAAAMDEPREPADVTSLYAQPDMQLVMTIMQEVVHNPDMLKIVHEMVQMPPRERQMMAKVSEAILNSKGPARRSTRRRAKPDALEREQEALILRASIGVQNRIESLLQKERTAKLTQAEEQELKQYEEMDDYLSLLNRLNRNVEQSQNPQEIASAS